jgi:hypothetical protein
MNQSQDAWVEVGDHLKSLGSRLKSHYQAQQGQERPEPTSRQEVKDARKTLGESVTATFGTIGDAVSDPAVTAEARETAGLFLEALGASFSELGADVSRRGEPGMEDDSVPSGDADPGSSQESDREDDPA